MRYHNITTDDMRNGDGLRTVLWLAGCDHYCIGCHNRNTWNPNNGLDFDNKAEDELFEKLKPDYISGLTLSGGDPLFIDNRSEVLRLVGNVKRIYPNKTIWLYTGYTWEEINTMVDITPYHIIRFVDVLVDGKFRESMADIKYPWAGSSNQRVIDVRRSIEEGEVIIYESN